MEIYTFHNTSFVKDKVGHFYKYLTMFFVQKYCRLLSEQHLWRLDWSIFIDTDHKNIIKMIQLEKDRTKIKVS